MLSRDNYCGNGRNKWPKPELVSEDWKATVSNFLELPTNSISFFAEIFPFLMLHTIKCHHNLKEAIFSECLKITLNVSPFLYFQFLNFVLSNAKKKYCFPFRSASMQIDVGKLVAL